VVARFLHVALASSVVVATVGAAQSASAQDRGDPNQRPRVVAGLFGSHDDPASGNGLDLSGALFGGTESYRAPGIPDAGIPVGVMYGAQGSLSYQMSRDHASFVAAGAAGYRYRPNYVTRGIRDFMGMAGGSFQLSTRVSLTTSAHVTLAPDYFVGDLGSAVGLDIFQLTGATSTSSAALPVGLAGLQREAVSSDVAAGADVRITERSTLTLTFGLRDVTDVQSTTTAAGGLRTIRAGARYSKALTEHASFVLGYLGGRGEFKGIPGPPVQTHDVEAGIQYGRPLPLSPRTTFSFGTGSTINSRGSSLDGTRSNRGYGVNAAGFATLTQQIGYSWTARLSYRRGLQFIEGVTTPFMSDFVLASVDGYAGRRLFLTAGTGYSLGGTTSLAASGRLTNVYAAAQARCAINHYVALVTSYAIRRYDLSAGLPLISGVATELQQQGVTGGVTVWLPLWR
jgi:hypothetical protein